LTRRPLGVFSDIDGTLSPIVERPDEATVTPGCRRLLRSLVENGVPVALITGRTLDAARSMVRIDKAAYAANHGLEYWVDGRLESVKGVEAYPALIDHIVEDVAELESAGVRVERKGPGVALHYRLAGDAEAVRDAILRAVDSEETRGFTITEGRKVIELRPNVAANKGIATSRLAEHFSLQAMICIGDDRTDIDMFQALRELRNREIEGVAIAVLSAESSPELLASADFTVEGVSGVEWFLGEVLKAVAGRSP
jgi:trehalose-phosphatase